MDYQKNTDQFDSVQVGSDFLSELSDLKLLKTDIGGGGGCSVLTLNPILAIGVHWAERN